MGGDADRGSGRLDRHQGRHRRQRRPACEQCTNAHRILQQNGTVSASFAWTDPADTRKPIEILEAEGLSFINGRADKSRKLTADHLAALTSE
jgi:hypothetical protein